MRRFRLALGTLLFLGLARLASAQIVFNATTEFSTTNGNPNGPWSYGWMDTGFTTFTLFTNHSTNSWYGWAGDLTPGIWLNTGATTAYGVPPGYLSQHPGPGTEPMVLRWTSPLAGLVTVSGHFLAGDFGTMQLAIFQNAKTPTSTLWTGTDSGAFSFSVNVAPGDTLNFAVFGGYGFGNTPIALSISAVPEPATWASLAFGLAAFALRARRRR